MTETNPETVATEASKQGTFSFLDRLEGRNYPKREVVIYLDEAAALDAMEIAKKRDEAATSNESDAYNAKLLEIGERLAASKITLHLEGISTEDYDATVDAAEEMYPLEYTETVNPLTMAKTREPVQNEEREQFFRTQLWAKYIRSAEDANGNLDTNISPEWVAVFMNKAPIMALIAVRESVEVLRMTTDWMDAIQTEDFFLKS